MTFKNRMGLAAAVAAVLGCGAAQAATVTTTTFDLSGQGLVGADATDLLTTAPIAVTLGADYAVNDTITLTFTGGNVDETVAPAVTCVGGSSLLVTFINSPAANAFNYRVTFKDALVDSTGDVCTWGGFVVRADSLVENVDLTVNYSARATVPNLPLDQAGTNSTTLFNVYDQFLTEVDTPFDATVDVESGRESFVGAPDSDTLVIEVTDVASVTPYAPDIIATLDSVVIVVSGDFSFAGCGTGFNPGRLTVAGGVAPSVAVAANCLSATITDNPAGAFPVGATWTYSLTAVGGGGTVLDAPQSFSATTTFNYDSFYGAADDDAHSYSAGSWKLNGFSAFVPYMPYNDAAGISQIIYITNKSNQSSALTIDAYNQAGVDCSFTTTTVAGAGAVTILTGAIKAGLEACYGAGFNDRVSFNVTGSLPGTLAELVTAYNVNGNRVQVINNSNGKTSTSTLGENL
jgi:hypothetical protein